MPGPVVYAMAVILGAMRRGSSLFFVFYNNIFLFYILLICLLGFYGGFV